MAQNDKISELISTVRDLNHTVRPKLTGEIGGGSGNLAQVHEILGQMRDRELMTSHGIKRMILGNREGVEAQEIQNMMGTASARITLDEALAIHQDAASLPTSEVLSAFTTAREAILSLLRDLPEDEWTNESTLGDTEGRNSVQAVVDGLLVDDKAAVSQISQLLG